MKITLSHYDNMAECKKEGWTLKIKNKNYVEYIEDNVHYQIDIELCTDLIAVYFNTIKPLDSNRKLTDIDRARIKKRVKIGFDAMGDEYEFC